MIDCEYEVYTRIATMLREKFPSLNIASEWVQTPQSFPHVSIEMSDNYTLLTRDDTREDRENLARVTFTINVYSNKTEGKKEECKKILNAIDDLMYKMNFMRFSMNPIPNMEDSTVYRVTARYRATTDGKFFYRG